MISGDRVIAGEVEFSAQQTKGVNVIQAISQ